MNSKQLKTLSYISYLFAIISFAILIFVAIHFSMTTNQSTTSSAFSALSAKTGINPVSTESEDLQKGLAYVGAGLAGIGFLGAGAGQGYAAGKAAEAVGRNPEAEAQIRNMMFVGAAIAESSALYALVVSIILIFVA